MASPVDSSVVSPVALPVVSPVNKVGIDLDTGDAVVITKDASVKVKTSSCFPWLKKSDDDMPALEKVSVQVSVSEKKWWSWTCRYKASDKAEVVVSSDDLTSPEKAVGAIQKLAEVASEVPVAWYSRCIPSAPKESVKPATEQTQADLAVRQPVNVPDEVPAQEPSTAVVPAVSQ
jgi:hypothetical protein